MMNGVRRILPTFYFLTCIELVEACFDKYDFDKPKDAILKPEFTYRPFYVVCEEIQTLYGLGIMADKNMMLTVSSRIAIVDNASDLSSVDTKDGYIYAYVKSDNELYSYFEMVWDKGVVFYCQTKDGVTTLSFDDAKYDNPTGEQSITKGGDINEQQECKDEPEPIASS